MFSDSFSENNPQSPNNFDCYALRQQFNQLFSHGWDFILKETPESNWKTIKKYKLTEPKCWYKYTDPLQIIGLRFGTETTHGLYDIDWGSIHDPREQEESLRLLKAQLELYGIFCFILIQSSHSQGLHLYFFLDRPVNTFRLACVMNKAAAEAKLKIKRGQLETFPNTKGYNRLFNGHRLPLQQGSYLLDKDYIPYSDRLCDLISAAEWSAARNDTDLLESRLEEAYKWYKAQKNQERIYNPTPEDKDFLEQVEYAQREIKEGFLNKIRIEIEQGFTGVGETNELLLTIAKLGRILYGLSGQKYIDYIKETVMSCPGYVKYCRHKHEIDRRCSEVARYGEKQWYPYRSRMPENRPTYQYIKDNLTNKTNLNTERQYNAQSRIIQAVTHLEQNGTLPRKVGECKLAIRNFTKEVFGVSISDATLTKAENLSLWHPKYRQAKSNPTSESKQSVAETTTIVREPEATGKVIEVEKKEIQSNDTKELKNPLEISNTSEIPQQPSNNPVIQETLQPEQPNSNQERDRATPCNVVRQTDPDSKTPKSIPSLAPTISCHTLPLMKGMMPYFLIEVFYQILQQQLSKAEIKKRNEENNNREFNSENINKTYKQKSPENLPKSNKENLSESQKYYQELLNRHPDWKASDEERQKPEYQKRMKNLFSEVKKMLKRKSQSCKRGFNNQNE